MKMNDATLTIKPIKIFQDNYVWVLINEQNKLALIVDPGDATPILNWLNDHKVKPIAILITHHHWDHRNGINGLREKFDIPVYGSLLSKEDIITHPVANDNTLSFPEIGINFQVIETPGHTLDHVVYFSPEHKLLLSGDTLFSAGCGRLFEGTPEQMHKSLQKISMLPDDTSVYCTHEYTLKNLHFAAAVEPNNIDVLNHIEKVTILMQESQPSLPSYLLLEKKINPFLRCDQQAVISAVEKNFELTVNHLAETFSLLRKWKDNFK